MNRHTPAPRAQLDLGFVRHGERTILGRKLYGWPFVLTRGFHLDPVPAHMVSVIVQTGAGAMHGEDRLLQRLTVGPDAAAHVTTQGATSVHRADQEPGTQEDLQIEVASGGVLEYLPQARILFPGAALTTKLDIRVDFGGVALLADGFTLHDPAGTARPFRRLASTLRIFRQGDEPLAIERYAIAGDTFAGKGLAAHGSMFLIADCSDGTLRELCSGLNAGLGALAGLYAAASPLPGGCGLALRFAAAELRTMRAGMQISWRHLRHALWGVEPGSRPG